MSKPKFYITTAIAYASRKPHVGNVYDIVLADMIARYSPEGLLVGSTALGKELAARIAARFHTGLTAECSGVRYDEELGGIVWSRPAAKRDGSLPISKTAPF